MVVYTLVSFNEGANSAGVKLVELVEPLPGRQSYSRSHIFVRRLRSKLGPIGIIRHHHHVSSAIDIGPNHICQLLRQFRTGIFTLIVDNDAAILHIMYDLLISYRFVIYVPRGPSLGNEDLK